MGVRVKRDGGGGGGGATKKEGRGKVVKVYEKRGIGRWEERVREGGM